MVIAAAWPLFLNYNYIASASQRINDTEGHYPQISMPMPIENSQFEETDSELTDSTESSHTTSVSASDEGIYKT